MQDVKYKWFIFKEKKALFVCLFQIVKQICKMSY